MNLLENQRAADTPTGIFQDLEEQLMANIIRHCKDYGQPIATDEWLLKKLAEIGKLNQENIRIIAKATGLSQTAMERMLNEMAEQALNEVEPAMSYLSRQGLAGDIIPAAKSRNVQQVMESMNDQAKDVLNRCNTTMLYKARDSYKALVTGVASAATEIAGRQAFLDILNKYADAAVIGAESRHQAMRKCIKEFNEKGIPAFVDRAGREWTPEAYVNMAMRNTVKNVADEVQFARCKDCNTHYIEISSHSGARPKCAKDQGKIYDLNNGSGYIEDANGKKIRYYPWNSTSYGEPDGILGINCNHKHFPFSPGEDLQRFFPGENMEANDKLYKETQVQRALERDVRKQKRECMLYDQIGDKEAFEQAVVKLKQKEAKLKAYADGNNQLFRRKDREQVVGFDKGISARAVAGNKKVQKELAEKAKNDKIKAEIKSIGVKGEIEIFPKDKVDVSGFAFDDEHINKERKHKVTREEAEQFIQEADISITKWKGRFINYYGPNGATFVDVDNKNIRTAFHKEEFDERTKRMREVLKKYGEG